MINSLKNVLKSEAISFATAGTVILITKVILLFSLTNLPDSDALSKPLFQDVKRSIATSAWESHFQIHRLHSSEELI